MGPLTFSVLRLLDDGEFHTIEHIAHALRVSQRRIQNTINDIDRYGIVLNKSPETGYQWLDPIHWLDETEIKCYLDHSGIPFHLNILDLIDSTNRFLMDQLAAVPHDFQNNPVIITELQTQGRGRLGRRWYSGLGDSLTFSLFWRFECPVRGLSGISLTIGVAIIRALTRFGIKGLTLKWPNDVLFCYRKLAGILIELCNDRQPGSSVVIGIGLNIQLSLPVKDNIDQAFVDLFAITGRSINRNKLMAVLLSELAKALIEYNQFGFSYFRDEWIGYHAYEGKLVKITLPDGTMAEGVVDGVKFDGSLTLNLDTGGKRSYSSGEITLRLSN